MKIRIENLYIYACANLMHDFCTSEQLLSMYVSKHVVFEGQPPLEPNLNPLDFYL